MKLFRKVGPTTKAILLVGLLGACQTENENALAPQAPATVSDQNARTAVATGALIKDGNTDLTYNSQNQALLSKESCPSFYYQFTYAPQLITATRLQYGTSSTEYKYTLDMSGRCVQSVTDKTYIYEYNVSGQLTKCYNKDKPNERREFIYITDADGWKKSLSIVRFYDEWGAKTKQLTFSYGATGVPDKCHLNPDVLPAGVSKYLPIFGTFNTNLVKNLNEEKYLPNGQIASSCTFIYSYTLDYAGKAKNITVKKVNGTLVSSTDRKYFTPTYNF
jgi:hypothetical protein